MYFKLSKVTSKSHALGPNYNKYLQLISHKNINQGIARERQG